MWYGIIVVSYRWVEVLKHAYLEMVIFVPDSAIILFRVPPPFPVEGERGEEGEGVEQWEEILKLLWKREVERIKINRSRAQEIPEPWKQSTT